LLLGSCDGLDLRSNHRKCRKRDSVELIEATPKTTLANTFEDLGHISVLVLIRAVGDDDENTESTSQIFDSLSLTSSGWSSWSSTIEHTEGLGKGHIASISKWSDAKSLLDTEELVGVGEVDISDGHNDVLLLISVCASGVLGPLEVIGILDFVVLHELSHLTEQLHLTHMDCHKSFDFLSLELVHVFKTHCDELVHDSLLSSHLAVKFSKLLFLTFLEGLLDSVGPGNLNTEQGNS
jgi:hypothetical protein